MAAKVARGPRGTPNPSKVRWQQVRGFRARRHFLEDPAPPGALLEAVARISGLHAQLLSSAELSAWTRVRDLGPGDVTKALFRDRTLVKTWAMRGTLHLLPAGELGLWQATLATVDRYLKESWLRFFGLTRPQLERLMDAISEGLEQGPLTREELAAAVTRLTRSATLGRKVRESSWGSLLKPAAYTGRLCFADSAATRVRFARPDSWLGKAPAPVPVDRALREMTRRYLGAYGPATREDYARFWGLSAAEAGRRIAALEDEAMEVDLEGRRAFVLRRDLHELRAAAPSRTVRLLPAFDPYVVAASPHSAFLMPGDFRSRVYRPQGWLTPVVLVGGRMDGVWRLERKSRGIAVSIEAFAAFPAWVRRAVGEEAERLARFFRLPLERVR